MTLVFLLFGLIFGSFLNMLLWRLPRKEGIGGRSHCPHCHHTLGWYDLVPVFSFLWLRGRCRYCHTKISIRYLLVELTCAIVLATFSLFQPLMLGVESILWVYVLFIFLALFFFDFYFFLLPDAIILPAVVIICVYNFAYGNGAMPLVAGLLYAGFFAILYVISRGTWLGFGDVKLALLIGLLFGYPFGFLVIVFGVWIGALIAGVLLLLRRATMKHALPLGSFFSIAAILYIIFQHEVQYLEYFFR